MDTEILPPLLPTVGSDMAVHFSSATVEHSTPKDFYKRLHSRYDFSLDVCANQTNAKCSQYLSKEQDGLAQPWHQYKGNIWMNPPYGKLIILWMRKMVLEHELAPYKTFAALVPARTDTKWWHEYEMPFAGEIVFVKGRLKFGDLGPAPFPSAVIIYNKMKYKTQTFRTMSNYPDGRKYKRQPKVVVPGPVARFGLENVEASSAS